MDTIPDLPYQPQLSRRNRSIVYQGIARLIWAQYCLENQIQYEGFDKAPADFQRELLQVSEAVANMALHPDMRDAALMCMAARLLECNSGGTATFADVSTKTTAKYMQMAESALNAYFSNLWTIPPDVQHRDEMARLMDAIAPKKGIH